jgi:uncharacterized membrane protein
MPSPDAGGGAAEQCPDDLPDSAGCPNTAPSYAAQVGEVIERRCAVCHYPGNNQSTKVFDDYAGIFAERRTMLTQIYGCKMPLAGAMPLSPAERKALLQWFVCGAPNN